MIAGVMKQQLRAPKERASSSRSQNRRKMTTLSGVASSTSTHYMRAPKRAMSASLYA